MQSTLPNRSEGMELGPLPPLAHEMPKAASKETQEQRSASERPMIVSEEPTTEEQQKVLSKLGNLLQRKKKDEEAEEIPIVRDAMQIKIEKILEEDLAEMYFSMPSETQTLFKKKGEQTAATIKQLIQTAKVTAQKIVELIFNWLGLIPGVNRFFLEQEAKIKTDKVLEIIEKIQ